MPRKWNKPNTDALRLKVHIRFFRNEVHVFGIYSYFERTKCLPYIWAESDSILTFCTLLNCCVAHFSSSGSPNADVCEVFVWPVRKVLKDTNYSFPNKFKTNISHIRPFDIQPMSCFEMCSSSDALNCKPLISRHTGYRQRKVWETGIRWILATGAPCWCGNFYTSTVW
jgi:hypothetical protein